MDNDEPMKKDFIPRWINTILVSLLLAIMTASFAKQKELNDNTEVLQVQLAVVTTKFDNHLKFADSGMKHVNDNTEEIHFIKQTYVTREEIQRMFNELKQYIRENK